MSTHQGIVIAAPTAPNCVITVQVLHLDDVVVVIFADVVQWWRQRLHVHIRVILSMVALTNFNPRGKIGDSHDQHVPGRARGTLIDFR